MIRVLVVDDHHALRAGLTALLRAEPGFVPVGACGGVTDALARIERTRVDVAIVDYELSDGHGLELCQALVEADGGVRSLVYSGYSESALTIPARLAGAGGLVGKSAMVDALFDAIRAVAKRRSAFPDVSRELIEASTARIDPDDMPLLTMTCAGLSRTEIADVHGEPVEALAERFATMVELLRPATRRDDSLAGRGAG